MTYHLATLPIDQIKIGDRFRVDMGDLEELAEGIREKGLLQPICVDTEYNLLAGGRRCAASKLAGLSDIPVLIRETCDEIDAREVELMENIHRKEMTWQEQAALVKKIHDLYTEKDPNWSGRKTAQLIEQSPMNVSRALRLAKGIEILPEIASCKTADDASKLIRGLEEKIILEEMAKRQQGKVATTINDPGASQSSKGLAYAIQVAEGNYTIGDVFEGMSGLKTNGVIDLIECDPPYGVDLPKVASTEKASITAKKQLEEYQEIKQEDYPQFLSKLCNETYRVAGKDCWMIFWFSFLWYNETKTLLESAGWKVDSVPGLWIKNTGRTPRPDILLARSYEQFFICRKGNPRLSKEGRKNTFEFQGETNKWHPAQRPVVLIEELLRVFAGNWAIVFVPFLGSGNTLRACYKQGVKGFGFDTNPEYKKYFLLEVEKDTRKSFSGSEEDLEETEDV